MSGPLSGIRVIELAAIGPVPFCGMALADMGADVIRIDRAHSTAALGALATGICSRGKRSVALDLKDERGRRLALRLIEAADVLIEGFRPGVAERLGLGPEDCSAGNPGLIYGRMTGWGQDGPMASMAGHDINYIGLTGALHAIGDAEPVVPLNLVADYGGGAVFLLTGVLAALVERNSSGIGQTVDAAMIDGAASLMTPTYQLRQAGLWHDKRRTNILDGAAPFYRTYRTADDRHIAVGALEPQFYAKLLELLGLDSGDRPHQMDRSGWPRLESELAATFASKPRKHWEELFSGQDACVTPVLSLEEAPVHEHNQARNTFMTDGSNPLPAPAPRFSRTPSAAGGAALSIGAHTVEVLSESGVAATEIEALAAARVIEVMS